MDGCNDGAIVIVLVWVILTQILCAVCLCECSKSRQKSL